MPLLTDINELKTLLEIPAGDTSEDAKLMLLIASATDLIEEFLGRRGLFYRERTEYYKGTGTAKLWLNARPVYETPTPRVWINQLAFWGEAPGTPFDSSNELTYGEGFALQIDQDNRTSRCGILVALNRPWPKPTLRQVGYLSPYVGEDRGSIKVQYTAGYSVEDMPAGIRTACNLLVMRLYQVTPYGALLTSESYEERNVSYHLPKEDLFSLIRPILWGYRNFSFTNI